ncbi:MAG: fumarylacetoacetate hydrolase family protein [Nitrososphaerota archaeon]|nr:fumarylacetoacetate hydrolase family protein [Nitrososphaerota archaeon]
MRLCRFKQGGGVSLGVVKDGTIYDLTGAKPDIFADLHSAYSYARSTGEGLVALVGKWMAKAGTVPYRDEILRIPVVPREVWAAGVTYMRSREARETETSMKGLYDHVYAAPRPELFVKDGGLRCRGPGDEVCVRSDSKWSVPEPELCVVLDANCDVIGYTAGDDVSSRDIEGENPLYLPQAKVYLGSSSIGPVITTPDEIPDPHSLNISMKITRGGKAAFSGSVNTSQMKRRVEELLRFLKRDNVLGTFTVLMTGTSIVPPDDFTLKGGDVVEIEIEKIGVLRNTVRQLGQ